MKFPLLILLSFIQLSIFSQSKLDSIKQIGYTLISDYSTHPFNTNVLTNKEFNGCLNNNPFDYFSRLSSYDTPLKQKIFKADSIVVFNLYMDTLKDIQSKLKSSFVYLEKPYYGFSNYDLKTKSFTIKEDFILPNMSIKQYNAFLQKLKLGNLYINKMLFSPISGIRQEFEIKTITILGQVMRTIYLKTIISIENEKDALIIEKDRKLDLLIAYDGILSTSNVYRIHKIIIHSNGVILTHKGQFQLIDNIIAM